MASSPLPMGLTRATMASRPDTAVSTVLEGGAGLFVTEANSIQALRDLRREEEREEERRVRAEICRRRKEKCRKRNGEGDLKGKM